jgi:hypothetical protein
VVRTDGNGDTLWCRRFDHDSLVEKANAVIETPDHGFAIVGRMDSMLRTNGNITASHSNGILLKLDSIGNMEWAKRYDLWPSGPGSGGYGNNLQMTDENGFMWADRQIIITDSLGNNCAMQPVTFTEGYPQIHITSITTVQEQGLDYSFTPNTISFSGTATISYFCNPQGTEEVKGENMDINVFPNPAHDAITVSSQEFGDNVMIKISDITGREILSQNMQTKASPSGRLVGLKTINLTPGIYFVKVTSDKGSVVKKFIRQ